MGFHIIKYTDAEALAAAVAGAVSTATADKLVVRDAAARAKFAAAAAVGDAIVADANVRAPDSTLLEGSSKATVQDHTPKAHTIASHSDTTGTGAELEELTDGSETTLHSHAAAGATIVRKTADKTLNNVAVLENDNHLLMAIGANEVWQIDIFILACGNTTADIKLGFSYPVNCLIEWGLVGAGKSVGDNTWGFDAVGNTDPLLVQTQTVAQGITSEHASQWSGYRLSLIVINGVNAGNINLQWCQNTAQVADTIVKENSCLIAHQLA